MNVLYVTYGLPWPPDRGARIRDSNLIKRVSTHHTVSLLSLLDPTGQSPDSSALEPYCNRIEAVELQPRSLCGNVRDIWSSVRKGRPLAAHGFYCEELAQRLLETVGSQAIDIIQFEHSFFAPYVDDLPRECKCKTVLDFHNVGFKQYRLLMELGVGVRERLIGLICKGGRKYVPSRLKNRWYCNECTKVCGCLPLKYSIPVIPTQSISGFSWRAWMTRATYSSLVPSSSSIKTTNRPLARWMSTFLLCPMECSRLSLKNICSTRSIQPPSTICRSSLFCNS